MKYLPQPTIQSNQQEKGSKTSIAINPNKELYSCLCSRRLLGGTLTHEPGSRNMNNRFFEINSLLNNKDFVS